MDKSNMPLLSQKNKNNEEDQEIQQFNHKLKKSNHDGNSMNHFDSIEKCEAAAEEISSLHITHTESESKLKQKNRLYGIACQIGSTMCFSMMSLLCKMAYQDNSYLTGFDYLLVRSASMILLFISQVVYLKVDIFDIHGNDRYMMVLRCILGGIGMPIYFIGLKYIPTSFGAIIVDINPIIIAILAFFLLQEELTKVKIFTVLGSFLGVAIFVLGKDSNSPEYNNYVFGIICSFICCITLSINIFSKFNPI